MRRWRCVVPRHGSSAVCVSPGPWATVCVPSEHVEARVGRSCRPGPGSRRSGTRPRGLRRGARGACGSRRRSSPFVTEVDVAERLEVRDLRRAERRLRGRRESEEQLGRIGNQLRAGNPGRDRHLLRQASRSSEPASGEAFADARHPEDAAEIAEEPLRSRGRCAPGSRCAAGLRRRCPRGSSCPGRWETGPRPRGRARAGRARRWRACRPGGAGRLPGTYRLEVWQAPRDGHPETGRCRARTARRASGARARARPARPGASAGTLADAQLRSDDLVVQRRYEYLDPVVPHDRGSRRADAARRERSRRARCGGAGKLVDELVDAAPAARRPLRRREAPFASAPA